MNRQQIDAAIKELYAVRLTNDSEACVACFSEDASFRLAGSQGSDGFNVSMDGKAALRPVLSALTETWHWLALDIESVVVDGNEVAVRYRLTTTHVPSGHTIETEIMDHISFDEDAKVRSMIEFLDTALVERVMAS